MPLAKQYAGRMTRLTDKYGEDAIMETAGNLGKLQAVNALMGILKNQSAEHGMVSGLVSDIVHTQRMPEFFGRRAETLAKQKLALETYLRRPAVIEKFKSLPPKQQQGISSMLSEVHYNGNAGTR